MSETTTTTSRFVDADGEYWEYGIDKAALKILVAMLQNPNTDPRRLTTDEAEHLARTAQAMAGVLTA